MGNFKNKVMEIVQLLLVLGLLTVDWTSAATAPNQLLTCDSPIIKQMTDKVAKAKAQKFFDSMPLETKKAEVQRYTDLVSKVNDSKDKYDECLVVQGATTPL